MLNIMEVHETNQMIEQEKLDVRTITMGISLLDCAADSVDEVCDNIYTKSPRTPRISYPPAKPSNATTAFRSSISASPSPRFPWSAQARVKRRTIS